MPTRLLWLLAQATPDKLAAVERLLAGHALPEPLQDGPRSLPQPAAAGRKGCGSGEVLAALARIEGKVDAVRKAQRASGVVERDDDLDDEELRKVYARVLTLSNSESSEREVSLKEVFDWYCGKGLSASKTAAALGCSKATVMSRLAELKTISGVPAYKLRTYQPLFEGIERSLREPRARRACGKQAA